MQRPWQVPKKVATHWLTCVILVTTVVSAPAYSETGAAPLTAVVTAAAAAAFVAAADIVVVAGGHRLR